LKVALSLTTPSTSTIASRSLIIRDGSHTQVLIVTIKA
jgi:hypothetical protein